MTATNLTEAQLLDRVATYERLAKRTSFSAFRRAYEAKAEEYRQLLAQEIERRR